MTHSLVVSGWSQFVVFHETRYCLKIIWNSGLYWACHGQALQWVDSQHQTTSLQVATTPSNRIPQLHPATFHSQPQYQAWTFRDRGSYSRKSLSLNVPNTSLLVNIPQSIEALLEETKVASAQASSTPTSVASTVASTESPASVQHSKNTAGDSTSQTPAPEANFLPNTANNKFIYLVSLEEVRRICWGSLPP